jgi:hypothetical protein
MEQGFPPFRRSAHAGFGMTLRLPSIWCRGSLKPRMGTVCEAIELI